MAKILVTDDNPMDRLLLTKELTSLGHEVVEAETGEQGLHRAQGGDLDVILLDFMLPGISGVEALKQLRKMSSYIPVILVTAQEEAEGAIEAMRYGAYDYLTKPVDKSTLGTAVAEACEAAKRMKVRVELEQEQPESDQGERIIGRSPAMWDLYKLIGQVAPTDATVLITGESGTGKELVARAVYQHSSRSQGAFLTVNCSALPETLLESELFGHEKGSFTGAHQRHIGIFERARDGTVFLDEIAEMKPVTQAKLLRVVQHRTFSRVGGSETLTSDVRILAATNRDIAGEVKTGNFREDLYYRLNVVHLHLPPLRRRKEDIPRLCDYLLGQVAAEVRKPTGVISTEAMAELMAHDWPGNVRELRNTLARAIVVAPTELILPTHFSFAGAGDSGPPLLAQLSPPALDQLDEDLYKSVLAEVEHQLFLYAMRRGGGSQVQAAKILGISRNMLRSRMKQLGIAAPGQAEDDTARDEAGI